MPRVTKSKQKKNSLDSSKPKSSLSGLSKPDSFTPESHPFIKKLAANDRPTRDKALEALGKFLQTSKEIPEMELLKLWRGLFYSMWFSDRPRTQQKLADELANLLSKLKLVNLFPFLDAFWVIMAREWENLDVHRLDKFLMLLRRYVAATFRRLKVEEWDNDLIAEYIKVAQHIPLNILDGKVSNGIRLHMFDIYLDELERIVKEDAEIEDPDNIDWPELMKDVPVLSLLTPIEELSKQSLTKFIRIRAAQVLSDERLVAWGVVEPSAEEDDEEEEEEESEDEWGGFE